MTEQCSFDLSANENESVIIHATSSGTWSRDLIKLTSRNKVERLSQGSQIGEEVDLKTLAAQGQSSSNDKNLLQKSQQKTSAAVYSNYDPDKLNEKTEQEIKQAEAEIVKLLQQRKLQSQDNFYKSLSRNGRFKRYNLSTDAANLELPTR